MKRIVEKSENMGFTPTPSPAPMVAKSTAFGSHLSWVQNPTQLHTCDFTCETEITRRGRAVHTAAWMEGGLPRGELFFASLCWAAWASIIESHAHFWRLEVPDQEWFLAGALSSTCRWHLPAVSSRGLFTVRGCEAERALRCLFPLRVKHFRSKDSVSLPKQQPCVPCRVQLFASPWTAALEAPLSMEFSRQEHWSGLPLPSPGIFLTQRSNLPLLCLLHRQAGSLSAEPLGKRQRAPTLNSLLNTFKDFGMTIQIRGVGVCVCTNKRQKHVRFEKGYWQRSGPTFCFSICDFFSFHHLFNKYLLSTSCVPGTVFYFVLFA